MVNIINSFIGFDDDRHATNLVVKMKSIENQQGVRKQTGTELMTAIYNVWYSGEALRKPEVDSTSIDISLNKRRDDIVNLSLRFVKGSNPTIAQATEIVRLLQMDIDRIA